MDIIGERFSQFEKGGNSYETQKVFVHIAIPGDFAQLRWLDTQPGGGNDAQGADGAEPSSSTDGSCSLYGADVSGRTAIRQRTVPNLMRFCFEKEE